MVDPSKRFTLPFLFLSTMLLRTSSFVYSGRAYNGFSLLTQGATMKRRIATNLYGHNVTENTSSTPSGKGFLASYTTVPEPRLLMGDVVSIFMAAQLMGLLDVLNDPIFWQLGGWDQPVQAVPPTFLILIQRDSSLSLAWILVALGRKGFQSETISTNRLAIGTALRIWVDFVLVRITVGVAGAFATQTDINTLEIARQCWFIALFVCGFRYIYSQYND